MRTLLTLSLLLAAACSPAPRSLAETGINAVDAGEDSLVHGAAPRVTLLWDRTFGPEGERPAHLVAGKDDRMLALTDRAIYLLDQDARQISRAAHPMGSAGIRPLVQAAHWDGSGLGWTLRWPGDSIIAAGWSVTLTDGAASFSASSLVVAAPVSGGAWGALTGGKTHATLTATVQGTNWRLGVRLQKRGQAATTTQLKKTLLATATVGDWAALPGMSAGGLGLCSVDPGGTVNLRLLGSGDAVSTRAVHSVSARPALGGCRLAGSGRSTLVTYSVQGLPYHRLDLGPGAPDMGVKGVSYPEPRARVVPSSSGSLSSYHRLSSWPDVLQIQDLLWDGTRYLVLLNRASYRGGRLLLTTLDETGRLLARDILIPLSYEPGTLLGARLWAHATGYTLLFASRRPWDEGVLHLARFKVRW